MVQHNVTTSGLHLADALVSPTGGAAEISLADVAALALAGATGGNSLAVDSIATMQAIAAPTDKQIVTVRGYTTADDGGGGTFMYSSASTVTADGGIAFAKTAGGTGRWIRQGSLSVLNIRWFGAKGNGVTDDGPALIRMRDYCWQDRSKHYTVDFPFGHYPYINNRWLAHIGSIEIIGNNSSLQSFKNEAAGIHTYTFFLPDIIDDRGDSPAAGTAFKLSGSTFKTVAAGSKTLTLFTIAEAAGFTPGVRVWLNGYEQQFMGYPPNMRYVEWHEIESVNAGTGVLTLKNAIALSYDEGWPDTISHSGAPFGKPRVLNLERLPITGTEFGRGYYYPRFIKLKDFKILSNPYATAPTNAVIQIQSDTLILDNIQNPTGRLWMGGTKRAIATGCSFGPTDIDKLTGYLEFDNCDFLSSASAATGMREFVMRNCRVTGMLNLGSRHQLIENNFFNPSSGSATWSPFYETFPVHSLTWRNNKILRTTAENDIYVINTGGFLLITAGAGSAGNQIVLADDATGRGIIGRIDIGFRLFKDDLSEVSTIERIYMSAGTWRIEAPWNTAVSPGNIFRYRVVQAIDTDQQNVQTNAGTRDLRDMFPTQLRSRNGDVFGTRTMHKDKNFLWVGETNPVYGYVTSIVVNIQRPYTGTMPSPIFYVYLLYTPGVNTQVMAIDLSQKSYAQLTLTASSATVGSTVIANLPMRVLTQTMQWLFRSGGNSITGTAAQMPIISIEWKVVPI